jgi:hypothetical protein
MPIRARIAGTTQSPTQLPSSASHARPSQQTLLVAPSRAQARAVQSARVGRDTRATVMLHMSVPSNNQKTQSFFELHAWCKERLCTMQSRALICWRSRRRAHLFDVVGLNSARVPIGCGGHSSSHVGRHAWCGGGWVCTRHRQSTREATW